MERIGMQRIGTNLLVKGANQRPHCVGAGLERCLGSSCQAGNVLN